MTKQAVSDEEIRAFDAYYPCPNKDLEPIGKLRREVAILLGRRFVVPPSANRDYDKLCWITEEFRDEAEYWLDGRVEALAMIIALRL